MDKNDNTIVSCISEDKLDSLTSIIEASIEYAIIAIDNHRNIVALPPKEE